MQPYQTSYPNPQMNPYQNNFNQPIPMQNPYIDRMAQLQQYQQNLQPQTVQQPTLQPQGLIGRSVNDFSEIKADDVPMNGTPAIFIKNDMSEIEVRVWCKDGLIRPTSYKPILEQNQSDGTNMPQNDFTALNEDMRALREDIKNVREIIEKSISTPTSKTSRGKKTEENINE